MRYILILAALSLTLMGCPPGCGVPESIGACGSKDPVGEIPWLKTEVEAAKNNNTTIADYSVTQATYKGVTVFWVGICCPTCDTLPPTVRYCDGTTAGQLLITIQDSEISNSKVIWGTNKGVCR